MIALQRRLGILARPRFSLGKWRSLRRSRLALDHLDRGLLEDIGISHEAAKKEVARPFWDVPENWKR